MRHIGYSGAAVGILVAVGLLWATLVKGQEAGGEQDHATAEGNASGIIDRHRTVGITITNQGNTRILWMVKVGSAGNSSQFFNANHEMDIHQIVISNGTWTSNRAANFGFALSTPELHSFFSATSDEYGTTTITFPIPLSLRDGDRMQYGYYALPGTSSPGIVEMTFIGTVPAATVDSLSVH